MRVCHFFQPLQHFCKDSQIEVMFANFTHQHTFHHERIKFRTTVTSDQCTISATIGTMYNDNDGTSSANSKLFVTFYLTITICDLISQTSTSTWPRNKHYLSKKDSKEHSTSWLAVYTGYWLLTYTTTQMFLPK